MLILLFFIVARIVISQLGFTDTAVLEQAGVTFIILMGISYALSALGAKMRGSVSSIICKFFGFFGKVFVNAIGWLLRTIIGWSPKMHKALSAALVRKGVGEIRAMLIAGIMVFIIIVIII